MWIYHYDLVQKAFCDPILKRTLKLPNFAH